jgi:hypothetical protein
MLPVSRKMKRSIIMRRTNLWTKIRQLKSLKRWQKSRKRHLLPKKKSDDDDNGFFIAKSGL